MGWRVVCGCGDARRMPGQWEGPPGGTGRGSEKAGWRARRAAPPESGDERPATRGREPTPVRRRSSHAHHAFLHEGLPGRGSRPPAPAAGASTWY
eukprot:scaffold7233_cov570-Prasinococcus_capsulatus_cf.AAC.13